MIEFDEDFHFILIYKVNKLGNKEPCFLGCYVVQHLGKQTTLRRNMLKAGSKQIHLLFENLDLSSYLFFDDEYIGNMFFRNVQPCS
jgi:hypothetical protein